MLIDGVRVLEALTIPALLVTPELVVVAPNDSYCMTVGQSVDDVRGVTVASLFLPASSVNRDACLASLEQVVVTGLPQVMRMDRIDPDGGNGDSLVRQWHVVSSPVFDDTGAVAFVLVCPQEVPHVEPERTATELAAWWQLRFADYQTALAAQARDLQEASEAEAVASQRLTVLAEIALQLAQAESAAELCDLVVERGLERLGATGGSLSLLAEGGTVVRALISASLGEETQATYSDMRLDTTLPACVTATTGATILLTDAAESVAFSRDMADVIASTACEGWASLPLPGKDGKPLGALVVAWADPHEVGPTELEVLHALAVQTAQGLERLDARERERAASAASARMSEVLQRSLLTAPQQPDNLQVAVRYSSAAAQAQVGGDWYDSFLTSDGQTMLAIGDVTGHDQDAAAVMGQLRNLLRGIAYTVTDPPAAVLAVLDRAMRDLDVGSMATAILAKISQTPEQQATETRTLRWSNAGHTPPLLFAANGSTRFLEGQPDLLLGLDAGTTRADHEVTLEAGCTVLLFTDGLVERRGADLDEGLRWLGDAVSGLAHLPLEEFLDRLLALVDEHADDDIALLALRAHGGTSRPAEAGPSVIPAGYGGVG